MEGGGRGGKGKELGITRRVGKNISYIYADEDLTEWMRWIINDVFFRWRMGKTRNERGGFFFL